jgi:hypothetical protein
VLLLPVLIGGMIGAHLSLVASRHHTQFPVKPVQTQRRLLGLPAFPAQTPRSLWLFFAVASLLFFLGGLVQINPIWQRGPFETGSPATAPSPPEFFGWGSVTALLGLLPESSSLSAVRQPGFPGVWPVTSRDSAGLCEGPGSACSHADLSKCLSKSGPEMPKPASECGFREYRHGDSNPGFRRERAAS